MQDTVSGHALILIYITEKVNLQRSIPQAQISPFLFPLPPLYSWLTHSALEILVTKEKSFFAGLQKLERRKQEHNLQLLPK